MKQLKAPEKITQRMTQGGAVEVNKATGAAANISAMGADAPGAGRLLNAPGDSPAVDIGGIFGTLAERIRPKQQAAQKRQRARTSRLFHERDRPPSGKLQHGAATPYSPTAPRNPTALYSPTALYNPATARSIGQPQGIPTAHSATPASPTAQHTAFVQPGRVATAAVHNEVNDSNADQNTGVQAAHFAEQTAEGAARRVGEGYRRLKFEDERTAFYEPEQGAASAEHGTSGAGRVGKTGGAGYKTGGGSTNTTSGALTTGNAGSAASVGNVNTTSATTASHATATYNRTMRLNPDLADAANRRTLRQPAPPGHAAQSLQKRKIKRGYAKVFRQGNITGAGNTAATVRQGAANAARTAKDAAQKAVKFAVRHWKGLAALGAGLLLLIVLFSALSSCAAMFSGGFNAVVATSYTAEDADIIGADGDYTALESALSNRIANIESEYPGYDEYRLAIDEIGHDPFELASYLTALYNSYTQSQAQGELQRLFGQQYTLTITPVTEIRYVQSADPGKEQGAVMFNRAIERLKQSNERIPDTKSVLKSLIGEAAASPDLQALKANMETMYTSFIQNYPPPVAQMAIDTSGTTAPPQQAAAQTNAPAHTAAPPPAPPKAATPAAPPSTPHTTAPPQAAAAQTATPRKPYKPRNAQNSAPSAPKGGKIHSDLQAGKARVAAQSADKPPAQTRTAAAKKKDEIGG